MVQKWVRPIKNGVKELEVYHLNSRMEDALFQMELLFYAFRAWTKDSVIPGKINYAVIQIVFKMIINIIIDKCSVRLYNNFWPE